MAIVLKKVTPMFNGILTTSDVYTIEDCTYNGIVDSEFVGKVKQINFLEDLAALTGATVIHNTDEYSDFSYLGKADSILVERDSTTIYGSDAYKDRVSKRVDTIKSLINASNDEFEIRAAKERLSKLTGGIATIYVGANSQLEMREKKDRIDDSLCAVLAALEEGIVQGGGSIIIH